MSCPVSTTLIFEQCMKMTRVTIRKLYYNIDEVTIPEVRK